MANQTEIGILVTLKDQATQSMKKIGTSLKGMEDSFKAMAVTSGAVFGATTALIVSSVKEAANAEADMALATQSLENSLKSMSKAELEHLGISSDLAINLDELKGYMEQVSTQATKLAFDDEQAAKSFAKLFAVTKDTTQANKELQIAMDLARLKGIGLEDATQKLIMVHSGATKELKAMGIAVDENATALENIATIGEQAAGQAARYADSTKGAWEAFNIQLDNTKQAIGDAITPMLKEMYKHIEPIVTKITEWISKNPELVAKILMFGFAASGLALALSLVGLALPGIIAGLTLLASPVGLVTAGVALAVAAFIFFRDELKELFKELDEKTGLITFFKEQWQAVVDTYNTYLKPALAELWDTLKEYRPVLEFIGKVIGVTIVAALYLFAAALRIVLEVATFLLSIFTKIVNYILEFFIKAFEKAKDIVETVVSAVNRLIDAFSRLNVVQGAKSFIGNVVSGAKNLIGLADGGVVTKPTLAMVGEGGEPEAVIPLSRLGRMGLGGGQSIVVNINGGNYLSEFAAGELGDMIIEKLKLNMRT